MEESTGSTDENSHPVVGAFNFKDWWITVWLATSSVQLPEMCACCSTTENLRKRHISLEQYPGSIVYHICNYCRRHAKLDDWNVSFSIGLSILLMLVGHYYFFGFAIPLSLFLITIYIGIFLVLSIVVYFTISLFYGWNSNCVDKTWPIEEIPDPEEEHPMGEDAWRTDELNARAKSRRLKEKVGNNGAAIRIRNLKFAKIFLREYDENPLNISRIREAF